MFLLFFLIFGICCIAEEISDSYKAYKYHQKGGFYAENPCFKPQQKNYPYVDKFCNDFEAWYKEYNKNHWIERLAEKSAGCIWQRNPHEE